MSITEEVKFDNRQRGNVEELAHLQRPSEPIATFTFDKDGHIERFPIFRRLFLASIIILVAILAFGIGRLTKGGDRGVVRIEYAETQTASANYVLPSTASQLSNSQASIVASKNSNKYHYSYCPGAKQISEKNKITFPTASAAEAAGYTLAANCLP